MNYIELIPAIDIINGQCVRLTKGDYDQKTVYNDDPVEVARAFEEMGFKRLHVVDLDGAKSKHIVNVDVLRRITTETNLTVDFGGAKPYHQAWERGVKIIGATSHYVTADLDAGPIIEQDVTRISHKDTPESLVLKGKDLEKIVLSHAVSKHIQRKILTYNNKTIIFS